MPLRTATAALALVLTNAHAQSPADPPCQYSTGRQIAFTSPASKERLTVGIGPGACHSATLSIVVTSPQGKVLYRYAAPFNRHVAIQWDDPGLPDEAREFVDNTTAHALVPKENLPDPAPKGEADEGQAELLVSASVYKRLVSSGQPVLYHPTYYEGGQYVVFDPATRAARVVARWGV
jgi:hypothetical protein